MRMDCLYNYETILQDTVSLEKLMWLCFNSEVYLQKHKVLGSDVIHVDIISKLMDCNLQCQHSDVLFY